MNNMESIETDLTIIKLVSKTDADFSECARAAIRTAAEHGCDVRLHHVEEGHGETIYHISIQHLLDTVEGPIND